LAQFQRQYPGVLFMGRRDGRDLAGCYAGADVFVFPSRTDTFGLVMIEALACGTPVAAFPVPGPIDIVTEKAGALSEDLDRAIGAALFCRKGDCAAYGAQFSWERAADQFIAGLVPAAEGSAEFGLGSGVRA
ncbi:glycosyltransferase, partial [Qipengyuania sp.]|uniref:glycosyltransferase n=1 Tax=Qipengyuania sp. TaxID=2004515 RepID=UPI0035C7CE5A